MRHFRAIAQDLAAPGLPAEKRGAPAAAPGGNGSGSGSSECSCTAAMAGSGRAHSVLCASLPSCCRSRAVWQGEGRGVREARVPAQGTAGVFACFCSALLKTTAEPERSSASWPSSSRGRGGMGMVWLVSSPQHRKLVISLVPPATCESCLVPPSVPVSVLRLRTRSSSSSSSSSSSLPPYLTTTRTASTWPRV